jgi:hypothetical protein
MSSNRFVTATRAVTYPLLSEGAVAFNGSTISVDHSSYMAQHDLVYHMVPTLSALAMPLGDGDLGAMVWCPEKLTVQLQKADLWDDPLPSWEPSTTLEQSGPIVKTAEQWRLLSAGRLAIDCVPSLFAEPVRYEQRLSPYSATLHIMADSPAGSCQVTAFVAANTGVLVLRYQDQSLRTVQRRIEVSLWRQAHLFALGETIGILQALADRRYALMVRVQGREVKAGMRNSHQVYLEIAPSRSCDFTLYAAVATVPRNGDPVSAVRAQLQSAMAKGYDTLLREHRQHWAAFWQKSFLRLDGGEYDPFATYLENLWYLNLYYLSACARSADAPLPNGALWLSQQDRRPPPALYNGTALRTLLAPLPVANHPEIGVPIVETYHRLLPTMAAKTSRDMGLGGAYFPERFNRFGQSFDVSSDAHNNGLYTALLLWQLWRHAPDPFLLKERVYPLLRACVQFTLERRETVVEGDPLSDAQEDFRERAALSRALRALLWMSTTLDVDEEETRAQWRQALQELGGDMPFDPIYELLPFSCQNAEEFSMQLREWLQEMHQTPQGWLAPEMHVPRLDYSAQLLLLIQSLLLREESLPSLALTRSNINPIAWEESFGGEVPTAIHLFPSLPSHWSAAFTLAAPGGFRVSAEVLEGKVRYIAVRSLVGGLCRLVNPWGEGATVRILDGRQTLAEVSGPILAFETVAGGTYLIERSDFPLSRAVRIRFHGRRNEACKTAGRLLLGLPALPTS